MRVWLRATLSALLLLGATQFASAAGVRTAAPVSGASSAIQTLRQRSDQPPATQDVQVAAPERSAPHVPTTPLAPSYPTHQKIPCVSLDASESGCFTVGLDVVHLLPTSRAPPARS